MYLGKTDFLATGARELTRDSLEQDLMRRAVLLPIDLLSWGDED